MRRHHYESGPAFNPEAVQKLLLGLTVSAETGDRLGVPAFRLQQWVRELAERLGDAAPAPRARPEDCGRLLSAGEIRFLLAHPE